MLAAMLVGSMPFVILRCGGPERQEYGEAVDVARSLPLAQVLETRRSTDAGGSTVVTGRIGEVCSTSGCWFALRDVKDGKVYELLIDLKGSADFTVPQSIRGRTAVVRGTIVGEKPDLKLMAVGLVVE